MIRCPAQCRAASLHPTWSSTLISGEKTMTSSARSSAMTVALRQPMTLDQFLAWEEQQELRYEFDGIGPVAMAGGTAEHDRISLNLAASLVVRLRGKPCRPCGSNLKVEVMAGAVRRELDQPSAGNHQHAALARCRHRDPPRRTLRGAGSFKHCS